MEQAMIGKFISACRKEKGLTQMHLVFSKILDWRKKRMAYNNGREDRKWRIWKEAEEKILREHGVHETIIEQIRTDDRGYLCKARPSAEKVAEDFISI